jgi:hypothetical protein
MDQAIMTQTVKVQAELPVDLFNALKELAIRRGVSANTIVQQAIRTEKLLADNVAPDDKVLITKKNNTVQQILFEKLK